MENWIKRDKRIRSRAIWTKIVLSVLIFAAVGLYAWRFYPSLFRLGAYVNAVSEERPLNSGSEVRAVVENILGELRLARAGVVEQPLTYADRRADFPVFRVPWPADYPYFWFTNRLQGKLVEFDGLGYDAVELDGGRNLLVHILFPELGDTLAEIQLTGSSKIQPEIASIAFIFHNFADFKIEDALSLVWLDIPFGFTLVPDQIPGSQLTKALKSSSGQCILEIPADREAWELIVRAHKLAGTLKNTNIDQNSVRAVFGAFPVLDGFYLAETDKPDRELIRLILDQAETLRLSYLRRHPIIGYADSLAYLKGMKIKELGDDFNCPGKTPDEIKNILIHESNDFSKHDKGIYILSSQPENIEIIKALQPLFRKLNIVQAKPLRIAKVVENL